MVTLALAVALASSPISVAATVEVGDISGLAVSPDGWSLAFRLERADIAANVVRTDWYIVPVSGGAPVHIADGGPALFDGAGSIAAETPVWTPASDAILFRRATDQEIQIWRAGVTGLRHVVQVTHDAGDVVAFTIAADGGSLSYSASAPRSEIAHRLAAARETGVRVDHRVDLAIGATGGGRFLGHDAAVRTTGSWFDRAPVPFAEGDPRRIALERRDQTTGVVAPATAAPPPAIPLPVQRALCDRAICNPARMQAWRIGPGRLLVRQWTSEGDTALWRITDDGGSIVKLAAFKGQLSGDRDRATPCAVAADRVFCVAAGADSPPRLVMIGLEGGDIVPVFEPNRPLAAQTAGRVTRVALAANGHRTTAFLVAPTKASQNRSTPLVVSYYRCDGFLRGGVGDELPIWPLADAGIAVLCINRVDLVPSAANKRAELQIAAAIVRNAVSRLRRQGSIDPRRVGMHGLSFGSEVTLWIAGHSDMLAAASIASGQIEPSTYWNYAVPGRDFPAVLRRYWGLGDPGHSYGRWKELAPALYADRIKVPVLMQLPEAEARWSAELYAKLARRCSPVELYVFPGASHIKSEPRQKAAAYERNLRWFRSRLLEQPQPIESACASFTTVGGRGAQDALPRVSNVEAQSSASTSSRMRR